MCNLKASYINELYKIFKRKKITVAAILSLLIVIIAAISTLLVGNFMGVSLTGKSEFSMLVLPIFTSAIMPLFIAFVCIDMFSGEFFNNTIKTTLATPSSRMKVFLAKVLAVATFIMAMLFYVLIISTIASFFLSGIPSGFFDALISYIVCFFPLLILALFCILISNITKGGTSAFMLCVLLYLAMNVVGLFYPAYSSLLFTSFLNMHILFTASFVNVMKIIRVFAILAGFGTMLYSLGYILFDKKEF